MARKTVEKNISFDDISNLYYVSFDYGKDENGKRIKKYKTYEKISEAKKALKEFIADKVKGEIIQPKNITVKEWIEYYLNDVIRPNRELTTLYGYLNMANKYIIPQLGKTLIQKLTPQQIQSYYNFLRAEGNLSSNTIRKHHDFLKTAFKYAIRQDIILKNPIDRVEPPKIEKNEINFYNREELLELLQKVEGNRIKIVVYLAVLLGLRREEICGLQWDNIDLEKRIIKIREAKTMAGSAIIDKKPKNKTSTRSLYITDELYEILIEEKQKQNEQANFFGKAYDTGNYLVCWEDGKPYRPNYISELFTKFICDQGLPKITLHGLRHSFVTLGNSAGETLYNLSKAVGHSTPDVTGRIYTHLEDNTHKDLLKNLTNTLFRKNSG